MMEQKTVNVIGGGLAGAEASWQLSKRGIKVNLFEMKPKKFSSAHSNPNFAELVCSNSLKSNLLTNACGLLKQELRELNSLVVSVADETSVPSGDALSVDREIFSKQITNYLKNEPNINIINMCVEKLDLSVPTIIATGPLTDEKLLISLQELLGQKNLYFFDAVAPIIDKNSLVSGKFFEANRYGEGEEGDYLNCPMTREEYDEFYSALISAETIELKDFEQKKVFEGCMAVEVLAKRGYKSLLFGPLKPVGLTDPSTDKRPYAVVQLRKESNFNNLYNMVGFQTNLKYGEQKRVFGLIPALKNAEFVRYGIMHKNSYVNAPNCLNKYYQLNKYDNIFIAGQLSGVEGYVESIASGMYAGINMANYVLGKPFVTFSNKTVIGALSSYISSANPNNFQPMNANWGIVKDINLPKDLKRAEQIKNSINEIKEFNRGEK